MEKISLAEKLALVHDHWSPKVVADLNGQQVKVVKLKGDWTNRDPAITSLLKELGRAGVPLYLWWAPGAERPKILPQVLTESLLLSELSSIH